MATKRSDGSKIFLMSIVSILATSVSVCGRHFADDKNFYLVVDVVKIKFLIRQPNGRSVAVFAVASQRSLHLLAAKQIWMPSAKVNQLEIFSVVCVKFVSSFDFASSSSSMRERTWSFSTLHCYFFNGFFELKTPRI